MPTQEEQFSRACHTARSRRRSRHLSRRDGVHGPLGAVIMSLRRIGWSLEKGFALRSDTDELIDVLQTPPTCGGIV